ncbi:hypothetical protein [Clostridium chromiireducens]|uniref:Dipeptidyl-peptidase IV n=1 Tax=Clostridium chromiireducens TaxID=225345 RepID=A0A1V4J149_9CLOT|nr:hypothetical protein [Clostridium chromiireducens]OPJ65906.1 hypothetical protein CLCHR_02620 [Clostridium chromiireducens]RII35384.1 hypothetical protein D2A34_09285 [Clostridium chromiireducens]
MNKNIKRRLTWFAIALILQQSIFLYVDKVYLGSDISIQAEKIDEEEDIADKKTEIDIKSNISEIKVSSDGRFVSYIDGNKLKILDSNDNKETECELDSGAQVSFYKWLNNEDNMIVIQKIKDKGIYYFEPISFDAKKGEVRDLADFDLNKMRIRLNSSKEEISNVVFSTLTHSLYIKVKKGDGKYDLYYANVMNQLKKVKSDKVLGSVVVPTTSTNAVMEEGASITVLNAKAPLSIPNVKSSKILGADVNDNVYFGEIENNKVNKIFYAVLSDANKKWNSLNLKEPVDKTDIVIDYSGKVYINNKSENSVLELISNKSIKYKGNFVQSYSKGIISRVDNKLIKNKLE